MKAEKTKRFIDMFLFSEKEEFPNNRLERRPSPKETQMLFHGVHVELAELERLAQIGADLEYVLSIKWIGNIPSVAHVQELAKIWREREGETNEDMV